MRIESDINPSDVIEQLIESTSYRDYILDGTPQAEDREANLDVLVSDAKSFATLPDFLEEVALMSTAPVFRPVPFLACRRRFPA